MAFTYNLATPTNITRVRYHVRDTIEASMMFSDEEIQFVIDEEGSWQKAAVSLLDAKITEFANNPDTTADWLRVSYGGSIEALRKQYQKKRRELGVAPSMGSSGAVTHQWRADSLHTEEPDYDK